MALVLFLSMILIKPIQSKKKDDQREKGIESEDSDTEYVGETKSLIFQDSSEEEDFKTGSISMNLNQKPQIVHPKEPKKRLNKSNKLWKKEREKLIQIKEKVNHFFF